jgi:hypothetical protein
MMSARTIVRTTLLALLILSVGSMVMPGFASAQLSARVFVVPPHNEIHLGSGGTTWCVNVEPIGGNFTLDNIDLCSVTLTSVGTGSVPTIHYDCTKPTVVGDADGNGLQDIRFCFLKPNMAPMFDNLHGNSPKTVTLFVNGNLITGGSFGGSITLTLYLKS